MDFVEQLKGSVDIVSVVGEYVRLRKAGTQRYMGLCPFHNEKTPSFTVHVLRQFYKCFSCGAAGDVINFVMEKEGISFYEALKSLADRYGIPMPKRSQYADDDSRLRGALFDMHSLAQDHFRANLGSSPGAAARAYLERRGVSSETAEQFGLGVSERSGRALLRILEQRNFPAASIELSGLVRKREDGSFYDYFRNRLMFPIHNESGKIIGFGGRALLPEDNPKYLNSPETPIYKKSHVLYNLHRAKEPVRKEDRVILVEGYMDAIGVSAAGFPAVVASCGTSLTTQQVQALKRHSQRIVVNFDPDAPGANAAERSISILLDESMQVRIMELDGGLDPDEYCKQRGSAAYEQRLTQAKGYFYWLADRARLKHDSRTTEGRVAILNALLPAVQRITDKVERATVAADVAGYLGIDAGLVLDSFKRIASERREKSVESPRVPLRHDERLLLNALLSEGADTAPLLEELRGMETIGVLPSRRIFQAIFSLGDTGGRTRFSEVWARLDEADRNLLSQAALAEDFEASPEELLASVESLRRTEGQQRRSRLKTRIRDSERSGRLEDAIRLMEELQLLERAAQEER
jgi:DNA primase